MKHANAVLLEKMYAHFAKGEADALLALCPEKVTFQIAGKSQLAGKYDRTTLGTGLMMRLKEYSGGTLKLDIHDVMASDRHGLVLMTVQLTRGGKHVEYRTVHVWRIENGAPIAGYEYPRDLYQFDTIWG